MTLTIKPNKENFAGFEPAAEFELSQEAIDLIITNFSRAVTFGKPLKSYTDCTACSLSSATYYTFDPHHWSLLFNEDLAMEMEQDGDVTVIGVCICSECKKWKIDVVC